MVCCFAKLAPLFLFCECDDHALLHVVILPENNADFLGK